MKSEKIGNTDGYVYDISLDGTVVNALGMNVLHNTDGFNFQTPQKFRYTKENPYISPGLGRNTKKDKKYEGADADVAEFEDTYMHFAYHGGVNKMGLDIDEWCPATINFSRKNYSDLLESGKTKKVGNTVKSKKMPVYIEKFLDKAIDMLLLAKGQEFIEFYYEYLEKIYNFQIPLRDIASKGKIKKTLKEYREDCQTVTKAGSKKARQAWYELLLLEDNPVVNMGDTIYYVNTGSKKGDADVKRVVHYYYHNNGEKVDITKDLNRVYNKYKKECKAFIKDGLTNDDDKDKFDSYLIKGEGGTFEMRYPKLETYTNDSKKLEFINTKLCKELMDIDGVIFSEDEIILNCKLLDNKIIEMEDDVMCSDNMEYNSVKYIEQFNKRINPLLVCFSPDIREKILVTDPSKRNYFTEEECKLTSGHPNKPTDQDTIEQMMTMDRREVDFWVRIDEEPPFVKECGMDWEKTKEEFLELKKKEDSIKFKELNEKYLNKLENLTSEDVNTFMEDGTIPTSLQDLVFLKVEKNDLRFYFKELDDMTPSTGGYAFDDISIDFTQDKTEDEFERAISEEGR